MKSDKKTLYHRFMLLASCIAVAAAVAVFGSNTAEAARADDARIIPKGIHIGPVDVGGLSEEQASDKVLAFIEEAGTSRLTMSAPDETDGQGITPNSLGLTWANPEVVGDAFDYAKKGNAVKRYKELKDLEHHTKTLDLDLTLDPMLVDQWLQENAERYEQKAVNYELHMVDGEFQITAGHSGTELDVEESHTKIMRTISDGWDYEPARVNLVITEQKPKGSKEELEKVKDLLGSFTTGYRTSGKARSANVENGCRLCSDSTVYPGEEFSVLEHITPFTEDNGYQLAASYLNGQVVDSLGGGICQVSTTLYNAVLLSELEVKERHNHSMIVNYVSPSADAAIAESSGKDFKFINNTSSPIYIEGVTQDRKITFNIYGCETRDPGHKVSYESETLEKIEPDTEVINANASLPAGEVQIQAAHIGYKAQLWRIVTENGEQVSREVINQSTYKMSPRTATVGTATGDPAVADRLAQAIATGSIDQVAAVANAVRGGQALPEVSAPPAPAPAPAPAAEPAPAPDPEPEEVYYESDDDEED